MNISIKDTIGLRICQAQDKTLFSLSFCISSIFHVIPMSSFEFIHILVRTETRYVGEMNTFGCPNESAILIQSTHSYHNIEYA